MVSSWVSVRISWSVWGEIPEQKMDLIKTDDSVDNSVEGFVRDVTYVLTIPAVVK